MAVRMVPIAVVLAALPLSLAGCGRGDDANNLAALDAQLTNGVSDPALTGALEDQIVVDPQLTQQANPNAVRPADKPVDGAVPVLKGDAKAAAAAATRMAGGTLMHAPAAGPSRDDAAPLTLGALAHRQKAGKGGCAAKIDYGMQWAERLPQDFPLYPMARLTEAAGADGAGCRIRAVSFVTDVPMQAVIDFYYTRARRAGYDASHEVLDGQHMLGGVRRANDGAYVISFSAAPGGGTAVDLIANQGM
ncbi:hypothetical protein PX699_26795 [Sphingobium sp. H39-3-25]|uniref:hypothetical protein n=1 Tax=Sphingobium arseniciresistens TaxID=3030834 RepID=UPI0023B95AA3|nr:hypothetical protein [Sphingobium arseniciresistens]